MKKILSIILILALVLAFSALAVGCQKTETPGETGTADPSTMTKDQLLKTPLGSYLPEKVKAGIEVNVNYSGIVDNEVVMEVYAGYVQDSVEAFGAKFSKTNAGGDVAQMISQIENFITMKVNMIVLLPPDGSSVKDAVLKAQEAGIGVMIYGCNDAAYSVSCFGDQRTQGYMVGELAYAYLHHVNPNAAEGSVKIAVLAAQAITPMVQKTNGILEGIAAHKEFKLVYFTDAINDLVDSGFNLAEAACTSDPELRYFCIAGIVPTYGACNYIMSINGIKTDEWCVVTSSEDGTTEEALKLSSEGKNVLRATAVADKPEGEYISDAVTALFTGEAVAPIELKFSYACKCSPGWTYAFTNKDVPAGEANSTPFSFTPPQ